MKFIPDLPTIRLIAGELIIGYFICLLPILLTGTVNEQTLMVGLTLASMFLIPAEFARLNKAKSKYREIEIPVETVASQDIQTTEEIALSKHREIETPVETVASQDIQTTEEIALSKHREIETPVETVASQDIQTTEEIAFASQNSQITEEVVNTENLDHSQDAYSLVAIPRQEDPLTSNVLVTMSTCTVSYNQHNLFESNASIGNENPLKEVGTSSVITLMKWIIEPTRSKKSDPLCMGNPLSRDETTEKSEKTAHSQEIPHSATETLSVFIDAAPEDMALVPQIEKLLKANEIEYKPPLDFSNPPPQYAKS
jgi:hypothetical protein